MNGLEEVQEIITNFIYERQDLNKQISKIELKRTLLAQERNKKKNACSNSRIVEVKVLGNKIYELGIQSQELQNKLDSKFYETKSQINLIIDNLIAEGIRKTRIIESEKQELEEKINLQNERTAKYEIQKQEFYERFGRVPELSENAANENRRQKEEALANKEKIKEIDVKIQEIIDDITELARVKREFKNKNWAKIIQTEEEALVLPLEVEEIEVEEVPQQEIQIEEMFIEEFEPVEELIVEEFQVEEFVTTQNTVERKPLKEFVTFGIEDDEEIEQNIWNIQEQEPIEEIEKIAKAIVEEIAVEQTKDLNVQKAEEIIAFEKNIEESSEETQQPIILSNIIGKIENGEIIYKAQVSNGKEIRIYPTKTIIGNQILRDKEKREGLKAILTNYADEKHVILDKKVINKIDPTVCEILVVFANIYNYDAQSLIYKYAMSFLKNEKYNKEGLPAITYNFAHVNSAYLSKKEKKVITRICKNARKNNGIDMVGYTTKFSVAKYLFKRIFAINNINALPEGNIK